MLNRGDEAERRNLTRGEIIGANRNGNGRYERTNFRGGHYVGCFVITDGGVVARDHIDVPVTTQSQS